MKWSTSKPLMSAFERAGLVAVDQTILAEEMGSLSTGMKLYPTASLPRKKVFSLTSSLFLNALLSHLSFLLSNPDFNTRSEI